MIENIRINKAKADIKRAIKIKNSFNLQMETVEICLEILNKIDSELNCQRIFLRIMKSNKWIDEHKFNVAMEKILALGKILGGLIKYYAKKRKNKYTPPLGTAATDALSRREVSRRDAHCAPQCRSRRRDVLRCQSRCGRRKPSLTAPPRPPWPYRRWCRREYPVLPFRWP